MSGTEQAITKTQRLLLEAALDGERWGEALQALADACGGRSGQLIVLNDTGEIASHWLTNSPTNFMAEVEAFGLANPVINPRVRIGKHGAIGQLIADQDHVDAETRARHPIYAELFDAYDFAFNCQTVVDRKPDALVRASVSRTKKQGPFDADAFKAFETLAPSVQAAVRLSSTLSSARRGAVLKTLDALEIAAFLLNARGMLIDASKAGDALLEGGDLLRVRHGLLEASADDDQNDFAARIARALAASTDGILVQEPPFVVRSSSDGTRVALDIQPLPLSRDSFGCGPAVLVAVSRQRPLFDDPLQRLRDAFRLTEAEAQVATDLALGMPLISIADRRGVSRTTIRSQIQSIYAKTGVHRQAELVAVVRSLD